MSDSLKFLKAPADGLHDMEDVARRRLGCPYGTAIAVTILTSTCAIVWYFHRDLFVPAVTAAVIGLGLVVWFEGILRRMRRTREHDAVRLSALQTLVEVSTLVQEETRKDAVVELIARLATRVCRAGAASVYLVSGPGHLVRAGSHGGGCHLVDPQGDAVASAVSEGRVITAVEFGVPVLLVPLRGTSETHGLVALCAPRGGAWFDPFVLNLARLFGSHGGLALERLHVIATLKQATMRDPLTGVGNRRRAAELLESLRPSDAILLIDLDHFKLVNDNDGHVAGDVVLVSLARYLRESLRAQDAVARYGGEEFLVVLRGSGADTGAAADRLCAGWRSMQPRTTFSVGGAVHVAGAEPGATFAQADAALYRAKRSGRDRTVVSHGDDGAPTLRAVEVPIVSPGDDVDLFRSRAG